MTGPERKLPSASIEFGPDEWQEEVERLDQRSPARVQAQRARREIESGRSDLAWQRCEADGPGGTRLPGCRKLYVPLGASGASDAPFGFVLRLSQKAERELAWTMIAFGERHPSDPRTRNVYERAHKRLHGHYPEQSGQSPSGLRSAPRRPQRLRRAPRRARFAERYPSSSWL